MPDYNDTRLTPPDRPCRPVQVRAGSVAVREGPLPDSRLATEALFGEILDVFEEQHGFALVQCQRDRYVGWVALARLSERLLAPTHRITRPHTHAYARPDLKSPPQLILSLGARVSVMAEEGDWRQCQDAGWVHHRHLAPLDVFEEDPVSVAERYIGTPYLWGGRSGLGLDCTGLTQQSFEAAGVLLPRDSDMQFAWAGEAIADWQAPGALQRGDIVFWKGHAGIMTDSGHLLHANAWHMAAAHEPFEEAVTRIAKYYAEPIGARRIQISSEKGMVPAWKTGA
ncbi:MULTISPECIES: NlpC/P60 family protein [unclassified Hyphomonas]|uniref:C40 family peptidase n=1 Tax=unclassified Hyphomonas TaxID=2630699 RepID=UPI0005570ADE|nr:MULTISPECIES: NlpC/P60 family protein [unclassified Hyphomonas]